MIQKPQGFDYLYFDWDKDKVTFLRNSDNTIHETVSLRELIESLSQPTVLIGESTFESYNLEERMSVWQLALNRGHRWYGTPNRMTARWRNRLGWEKADSVDVQIIRLIAEWPYPLNSIRGYKEDAIETVVDGKKSTSYPEYTRRLDVGPYVGKGSWTRLRPIAVRTAEEEAQRRTAFRSLQSDAMEFRRLPQEEKEARVDEFKMAVLDVIGEPYKVHKSGKVNKSDLREVFATQFPLLVDGVVWATAFAAKAANNRREFEMLLGAHAHGAKSLLRSQFHHWGWLCNGKGPMVKGVALTDYRRQVRQLGALVAKNNIEI